MSEWQVFPVVAGEPGRVGRVAIFGSPLTLDALRRLIGDPFTEDEA